MIDHREAGPVRIAFRRVGEGAPLLMFHGGEGDHQIYDKLQDALAPAVTSLSFDQRDCGLTEFPDPAPYGLADIVEDGVRLLDALGLEKAHVLGNSVGGVMAQLMAVRWPDRVDRLVLGLTWPADEQLQDLNPAGMARRAEYAALGEAGERLMVELMAGPGYLADHPEILDDLRSLRRDTPPEARQRRWAALMTPSGVDPAAIGHETLIVGGGADQMVPAAVTGRLAGRIPRARFEILPGVGHLAARQAPEAFATLVRDFLHG